MAITSISNSNEHDAYYSNQDGPGARFEVEHSGRCIYIKDIKTNEVTMDTFTVPYTYLLLSRLNEDHSYRDTLTWERD